MIKFIKWFFSQTEEEYCDPHEPLYQRFLELEDKYYSLLKDVRKLEEENVENTNLIYENMHSIDAVDRRIDILAEEFKKEKNV